MCLEEECQQLVMAEHLEHKRRNREKTIYEAQKQKTEQDATLALEDAKRQAQLLIKYGAINQRVKLFLFSSVIIHLYT